MCEVHLPVKKAIPIIALLLFASPLIAQTTVSGTAIHDKNQNLYSNGTASAQTVVASGLRSVTTGPIATDSAGSFSMSLATGTYTFTLCALPVNIGPTTNPTPQQVCFTSGPIAVSGGSLDISSQLNALAAQLGPNLAGATAGTVTNFSSGNLSPIFSTSVATSTSTPALSFSLSNFPAKTALANGTGSSAPPTLVTFNDIITLGGGLTSFASGNLSPIFTTSVATPTSTPVQSFSLSNFPTLTALANATGSPAPPTTVTFDQIVTLGGGITSLPPDQVKRICTIPIGADNAANVLVDADIGPQRNQCRIPFASTAIEVVVNADAGVPSVIVQKRHCSTYAAGVCTAWTDTDLLSSALAAHTGGFDACSNTAGTTGLDGGTTCSATLQNTAIAAGDWLQLKSGTAGGTAKRLTTVITLTIP